ncbi:hypothetical protein UL82_09965 [Corynebacterium kutscheri]|uniref:Uncharacterized protein n=1 Tax=Corynebacterium kutscheri TaxID=35755 RepID=A0A0F6R1X6_9CORY|nr:hypothetical protein [Corynebacterium kutscheri]AKE42130.1 hypothetical protein UL82_09965 [Corynebacterium kutscheri]VEH10473.1 Uncharacterised protein [Corynebacterium kutscheri]
MSTLITQQTCFAHCDPSEPDIYERQVKRNKSDLDFWIWIVHQTNSLSTNKQVCLLIEQSGATPTQCRKAIRTVAFLDQVPNFKEYALKSGFFDFARLSSMEEATRHLSPEQITALDEVLIEKYTPKTQREILPNYRHIRENIRKETSAPAQPLTKPQNPEPEKVSFTPSPGVHIIPLHIGQAAIVFVGSRATVSTMYSAAKQYRADYNDTEAFFRIFNKGLAIIQQEAEMKERIKKIYTQVTQPKNNSSKLSHRRTKNHSRRAKRK